MRGAWCGWRCLCGRRTTSPSRRWRWALHCRLCFIGRCACHAAGMSRALLLDPAIAYAHDSTAFLTTALSPHRLCVLLGHHAASDPRMAWLLVNRHCHSPSPAGLCIQQDHRRRRGGPAGDAAVPDLCGRWAGTFGVWFVQRASAVCKALASCTGFLSERLPVLLLPLFHLSLSGPGPWARWG